MKEGNIGIFLKSNLERNFWFIYTYHFFFCFTSFVHKMFSLYISKALTGKYILLLKKYIYLSIYGNTSFVKLLSELNNVEKGLIKIIHCFYQFKKFKMLTILINNVNNVLYF